MSWLRPLSVPLVAHRPYYRTTKATMARFREVVIDGVRYPSMVDACKALRWSYSRVYKAIGEAWRYAK